MRKTTKIKAPSKSERIVLRIMILLGLISFAYFFYWFLDAKFIDSKLLFGILFVSILYDTLKILYIWYHYWDISVPEKPAKPVSLTVDVLTTYFPGEPYDMIKETLLAIQRMRYPHTTYLCDEANDQYLKGFCEDNGIIHVTRNNRIDAKAGNINNALKQAKGDICLILDPDHVPFENFLEEVLPYFADETIGFVQTVQAYYNVKESAVAKGAAEQTFHFYGPVMMSMNSYGTVNAIGANCVFRRKALDSIGGHAAGLSEDMHTAMQLHAKGWKSVYVPRIFTKGLAPASLTAYYKQQMKWSRGTLELLVSVYPKLFTRFTWRQRLHYGILPFHYLSGISYLINFIVPVYSLVAATTPWKGNIINFGLFFIPVLISIFAIRFYVQRWLMYKSERGIHTVGGLLQTCTWWINNVGLIYTLIRRKVPYLPTPKDSSDKTSWKLVAPNIVVGVISILAVIYGLSVDFTPFSIFMSGFALLNALFMFSTIYFGYQRPRIVSLKENIEDKVESKIDRLQNVIFHIWRKASLPVMILVLISSIYLQNLIEFGKWEGVKPEVNNKHLISYLGIFAPKADNGITDLRNAKTLSKKFREKFDMISLYLPWDKNLDEKFPEALLDSIYQNNSIPLIAWEPWLNTFKGDYPDNKHVYDLISSGFFDNYISRFATKLKNLNRPVFLRFAHEFDNPFYPWYFKGYGGPEKFKNAWKHAYELFKNAGAENVIWVWNPWKPQNVEQYYPGEEYVDWIGVNILNYGQYNQDQQWHEFEVLYRPFHEKIKSLPLTPVIITEFGTLNENSKQPAWIRNAFNSIEKDFSEIKSVIYFNSKVDDNWPVGLKQRGNLDWTISENTQIENSFDDQEVPGYIFRPLPDLHVKAAEPSSDQERKLINIHGINFKKGNDWRKDYHVLNRKNLLEDFRKIKALGINAIKIEGNSIYNYNIINLSREFGFDISYSFWIPEHLDFAEDTLSVAGLRNRILKSVRSSRNNPRIISWNIENDVQYKQKDFFLKPRLLYQNRAYVSWLRRLVSDIKKIDGSRPVVVNLEVNLQTIYHLKILAESVPGIDYIGLVVKDSKHLAQAIEFLENIKQKYLISEIGVTELVAAGMKKTETPFFIRAWRDVHESNKLTFEGLVDRKGRRKADYFELQSLLNTGKEKRAPDKIRILRPATLIYEGKSYDYIAMSYDSKRGWREAGERRDLSFEWSLIKCDFYGNYLAIREIGTGPVLSLPIPPYTDGYRLLLTTLKGDTIFTDIVKLNTPLVGSK